MGIGANTTEQKDQGQITNEVFKCNPGFNVISNQVNVHELWAGVAKGNDSKKGTDVAESTHNAGVNQQVQFRVDPNTGSKL